MDNSDLYNFSSEYYAIDISHHNTCEDWEKALEFKFEGRTLAGCFMKATEGVSFKDPKYLTYSQHCQDSPQITIKGAYHFYRTNHPGEKQAEHMAEVLKADENFDMKSRYYIIDLESNDASISKNEFAQNITDFIAVMVDQGFSKPMIYTTQIFWDDNVGDEGAHIWNDVDLWVARYGKNNGSVPEEKFYPKLPKGAQRFDFWQFTDKGRIDGFSGDIDLDLIR